MSELIIKMCTQCSYRELINKDIDIVLLKGDYYDKTNDRIEGYLQALDDNHIKYDVFDEDFVCNECACSKCLLLWKYCECEE